MKRSNPFQRGRRFSERATRTGGMVFLLAILALSSTSQAAIFVVDKTTTDVTEAGTLNWAIDQANTSPGFDEIHFALTPPGTAPPWCIIQPDPTGLMPVITDMVLIDGYTQPGTKANDHDWTTGDKDAGMNATVAVVLDGSLAGPDAIGLDLQAGGSRIRGLSIVNFADTNGVAIRITGENVGGDQVDGCYIGVLPDGKAPGGNETGVLIDGSGSNLIGGQLAENRNVISTAGVADQCSGVHVRQACSNIIEGNLFGMKSDGLSPLAGPAGGAAIWLSGARYTMIGGHVPEARNAIGNHTFGVLIFDGWDNEVRGNYIGTNLNGDYKLATPVGNGHGVRINDSSDNIVGGNVIAHNHKGVVVVNRDITDGARGNTITCNSIARNDSLGIDLENDDVTRNDGDDPDVGANDLQDFPIKITAVRKLLEPDKVRISGILYTHPNTEYRVEFFASRVCDPLFGFGEGARCLGALDPLLTGPRGKVAFSIDVTGAELGDIITATTTDPFGSTSEFSRCGEVTLGIVWERFDPGNLPYIGDGLWSASIPLATTTPADAYDITASLQSEDDRLDVVASETTYKVSPFTGIAVPTDSFLLELSDMGASGEYVASLLINYRVDGSEYEEVMPVLLAVGGVPAVIDTPVRKTADLEMVAYPNPANPFTNIAFELPATARVQLRMFDASGALVKELADEALPAGRHSIRWDGLNRQGRMVPTGVYYYQLIAGKTTSVGKVMILK
jgi:FlgD Ig-like domain